MRERTKKKFRKICLNKIQAIDHRGNPLYYKRNDLTKWAQEARDRGDTEFYIEAVDPLKPNGELQLTEPVYGYELEEPLTEDEFRELCGSR